MNITADRMAAAYFDAFETLCRMTPKGGYAERGTARAGVTQAGVATLNAAYDRSTEPDLAALDEMATEVGGQAAQWSIIVRGEADDQVAELAARHGLLERAELPVLACAADDLTFRAGSAERSLVRQVGAAENDLYTDALTRSFEVPEGLFGSLMGGAVLDADPITGYLAEESGRPVGTGLGMRTAGVIGVFNIAVVPSARGRGLGRVITETVLRDGIAAGADAAYLHTSVMGRPLYESMGFTLVETWTMFHAR
ncbi:GNAT family N-acetyltransferase [Micromonospora hortensis]|uniref:GNAT family N-acetyltransferase n=1 Tax=Micromonospora hortensis TaxID=2911209 RepID=UPI001EE9AC8F|nr:GNAT family N-acetyltransferase [Micromonospora hortensis]MCG5452166.1 GNAT family N-acetyltransferase [Micromonospora hortensis]